MTLPLSAKQYLERFSAVKQWEDKMRLLMKAGDTLLALTADEQVESNQVKGCESQVWLVCHCEKGVLHVKATSDARLMRGLLAVVLARIEGLTLMEIETIDFNAWFAQLGLERQLSSSKRDGLNAIFERLKQGVV